MKHQFYAPYFLSICHVFLIRHPIQMGKKKEKIYSLFCPSLPALLPPLLMPCWMLYSAHQLTALALHTSPDLNPLNPSPSPFRAPVVTQKGGFVIRQLTMKKVTLMLHSKMYGLAQSSGRSCSITFLCVSMQPLLNICSHVHHWQ